MQLRSIALTALIGFGVWYWLRSREIKEAALRHASTYCEKLGLSLLDQTVALRSVRLGKDEQGRRHWQHCYHFEFSSTGTDRYQGVIRMQGKRVAQVTLAPHRLED